VVGPRHRVHDPRPAGVVLAGNVLALQWSQGGQIPVPATAWYHNAELTFADCVALVRRHLWRARYVVNSAAEPEFVQCLRETFDLLLIGLPLAA
jgi:hypothetical protein